MIAIRNMEITIYKELSGSIAHNTMCIVNPEFLNQDMHTEILNFQTKLKNGNKIPVSKKVSDI